MTPPDPLYCPVCQEPLRSLQTHEIVFQNCHTCGGTWLYHAAIERVMHSVEASSAAEIVGQQVTGQEVTRSTDIPCPVCWQPMQVTRLGWADVEVDTCPRHGTWYDPSELHRMAVAAGEQQDKRALSEPDGSRAADIAVGAGDTLSTGEIIFSILSMIP